jgi:glucosamine-6-phosphate deaminase
MNTKLFNHININMANTYIPSNILIDNPQKYDELIKAKKGIDLQILGIGENGHIGFNEPGSNPNGLTSVVNLTESTINANSRLFDNVSDVPKQALSMGIGSIMAAKEIILLASGIKKAEAIKATLNGEINSNVPSSYLQEHPSVTIIMDKAAASLCKKLV